MANTSAKENILNRIKEALNNPVPLPFPLSEGDNTVFVKREGEVAQIFEEEFEKLQGQFTKCRNADVLKDKLEALFFQKGWTKIYCQDNTLLAILNDINVVGYQNLATCEVSLTTCEYLVARTGSMVLSSAQQNGRTASVYAPIHICIAYASQLLYDVDDALKKLTEKYSNNFPSFVTFASGPSRTADIEKTLVTGVHGPKEVFCFLIENN